MKILYTKLTKTAALFFLLIVSASAAFAQNARMEEWFVADKQVDCTGVAPQKCLVVREVNSPDWKYFYSSIAGFNFRDGYTQKIRIRIAPRKNVPADASSLNYRLVRVLSRSKTDGNTLEEAQAQINKSKNGILTGRKWTLTEINGESVAVDSAFIEFRAKEKRFGAKICNSMGGSYRQSGGNLKFSKMVGTLMACPEPLGTIEKNFSSAMEKVTRFEQTDNLLVLYAGTQPVLKFASGGKTIQPNTTLENVRWSLTEIEGEELTLKSSAPFLFLDKEKSTVNGFSACNSFFGKYELSGSSIKLAGVAMTRKACLAPEIQRVETNVMAALENVNRYEIKNSMLNLYSDDKLLLKFMSATR